MGNQISRGRAIHRCAAILLTRQMHSDSKKRRSFLALLFAADDLQRSRHACGAPRTGRAELRPSACPPGRRRRPFEQSLEPRRPNAVLDRTSTPGARPTRLSSPSWAEEKFMGKRYWFLILNIMLILTLYGSANAGNFSVTVQVYCDDSFTQELIKGYILRELRIIQRLTIVDKKEQPQIELSIVGTKTDNNWIALSIMKVQHIWSQEANPRTGNFDYAIGRADHHVAILPNTQLKQTCSEIVAEFDATYIESLRR